MICSSLNRLFRIASLLVWRAGDIQTVGSSGELVTCNFRPPMKHPFPPARIIRGTVVLVSRRKPVE